jgi:phosphoribosylglycinamide formyltransferase-1
MGIDKSGVAANPVRVAVLVSGGGTNLQALLDQDLSPGKISIVISSSSKAYALERARKASVPTAVCRGKDYEKQMADLLKEHRIDLVVLAGYLKILTADFLDTIGIPVINVHPALLPKFGGKGYYGLRVHEAVLGSGDTLTGATVHYVNAVTDGGQIIRQKEVPVKPGDTPEILQRRVMEEAEWVILPQVTRELCQDIAKRR